LEEEMQYLRLYIVRSVAIADAAAFFAAVR
jgi:hypothetical protein